MLAILIGTVLLHILNLILLLISTSVNAWKTKTSGSYDLWDCAVSNGDNRCDKDWLQAVQALMILATIFCILSLIFFLCQLFTLNKGGRFFFTAIFQILSSIFVMCAAIIYTVMNTEQQDQSSYGYAFILAWLAFPLTLISGLIYIVLRKK